MDCYCNRCRGRLDFDNHIWYAIQEVSKVDGEEVTGQVSELCKPCFDQLYDLWEERHLERRKESKEASQ